MNRTVKLILGIFLLLQTGILSSQNYEYYTNARSLDLDEQGFYTDEYGDCYVECLLIEKYGDLIETRRKYPEVVGRTEIIEKGNLRISIAPEGKGWVKKKVDNTCLSQDPEDCLVKCLVTYPEHLTGVEIIDDTKAISLDDFNERELDFLRKEKFIVYSQAPCEIEQEDFELLYAQFGSDHGDALIEMIKVYQAKNGLPIGELNMETIHYLGLN